MILRLYWVNKMYDYKQIDILYDIKKKMLASGYWDENYPKAFPDFQFCTEGRYVWQENNESEDEVFISNIETIYTTDKDKLVEILGSVHYKFLMDNISLFHTVYRISQNLVVTLV